jgi:formate dehydrogenase subunit gamma
MNEDLIGGEFGEECASIARTMASMEGALLPILHSVQERFGYIPATGVPAIAAELNLSRAEVHGVISFYHDFRQAPNGDRHIQICRAEACRSVGSEALAQHAVKSLGVEFEQTHTDHSVSLESVYCLGLCACGPAVRIDNEIHGRVSTARFDELIES